MMVASDNKTQKGGWRKRLFNNKGKHHKNDPGSPTRTKSSPAATDANALKSAAQRNQPQHETVESNNPEQAPVELPKQVPKLRKKKSQPFADFVFPDEAFNKPFGDGLDQSVHSVQSSIYSEFSDADSQRETDEEPHVDEEVFTDSRRQGHDRLSKSRQILTRPFGRQDLPQVRPWVVEVSPAEWDANENRWKYRVLVQRRVLMEPSAPLDESPHSFTTAFTWRSLADFLWLEKALKAEFHGALMLPLLSIAIGTPNLLVSQDDAQHDEVDATLLRDWFSDVLNGIRGQGELVLNQQADIISSEAMEAFLYRNTNPMLAAKKTKLPKSTGSLLTTSSQLDNPWRDSPVKELQEESFVQSLWTKPLLCGMDSLCGTVVPPHSPQRAKRTPPRSRHKEALGVPLEMGVYSSRALNAGPSIEQTDSFVPFGEGQESSSLAIHSELLEAERELVLSYRHSAMTATERLRSMMEQENQIGAGWKRLGEALSSLFNFEKDVESTKLLDLSDADKKKKIKHPYRKLGKGTVDDLLRAVVRQRLDRSIPSLSILSSMLGAYVGDLSAVAPSVKAYMDAITQLAHLDQVLESSEKQAFLHQRKGLRKRSDWGESINALASNFDDVKKKVTRSFSTNSTETSTVDPETVDCQRKQFERRVRENERMLRGNVTSLCKATPVRSARMAHMFLSAEAAQAQLLNSSALSMRAKMNVADQKTVASVKKQHIIDNKEDNKFELDLIKRIVEVGSPRKTSIMQPEFDENGFPIIQDIETENSAALRRDRAMELARERVGMWDSDLAMAIMEACGIQDAEVQVEETTRDLRRVRRQAIGLRENVDQCSEAIKVLKKVVFREDADFDDTVSVHTGHPVQPVHETRNEFWDDMSAVFSGAMNPPSNRKPRSMLPSVSLLGSAGIVTNDPTGWMSAKRNGKCREASQSYLDTKDSTLASFLNDLEVMLHDYEHRIECIESFVYMQCVGIQLEKHFSKKRTDALTAFEKKTDITTAINIANRKKLPRLVVELQAKMEKVAPNVSATTVKESKESHLLSKQLKTELSDLANRRFQRVRESSMDRIVSIITAWAKYEETAAKEEIKAVGGALDEIEQTLKLINVKTDGISHTLFAPSKKGKP